LLIRRSKVFASFEFHDYFHNNTSTLYTSVFPGVYCPPQDSKNNQLYSIKLAVEGVDYTE